MLRGTGTLRSGYVAGHLYRLLFRGCLLGLSYSGSCGYICVEGSDVTSGPLVLFSLCF